MTLAEYLRINGIHQRDFAASIRSHQANVHWYVTGQRRPSLEVIERIQNATNGMVRAEDFMPSALPVTRPKRRARKSSPTKKKGGGRGQDE